MCCETLAQLQTSCNPGGVVWTASKRRLAAVAGPALPDCRVLSASAPADGDSAAGANRCVQVRASPASEASASARPNNSHGCGLAGIGPEAPGDISIVSPIHRKAQQLMLMYTALHPLCSAISHRRMLTPELCTPFQPHSSRPT